MSRRTPREILEAHPRLIGVLFFLLATLAAAEPVAAGNTIHPGP